MSPSTQSKAHFPEVDILRGLAAILMIVNHAGAAMFKGTSLNLDQAVTAIFFIGSFAPVLFFFVTGVGSGIQSYHKKPKGSWSSVGYKVGILLLADLFLHWSVGRPVGLDFLGFIGLCMLVLEALRRTRSPLKWAVGGIIGLSLLRYVIGPKLRSLLASQGWLWLDWITGTNGIDGISYPLTPWMVYPLAGFLLGTAMMRYREALDQKSQGIVWSLILGGSSLGSVCFLLGQRGVGFFRWGMVSIGFYIASVSVLMISLAIALVISRSNVFNITKSAVSLKGVASLAVVPIHYGLIHLLVRSGTPHVRLLDYSLAAIGLVVISFMLAHIVEQLSGILNQIHTQKWVWFSLASLWAVSAVVTLTYGGKTMSWAIAGATLGQLCLCLLLTVRAPFPVRAATTPSR